MLAYTFIKSSILTENFGTKISFELLVYFTSDANILKDFLCDDCETHWKVGTKHGVTKIYGPIFFNFLFYTDYQHLKKYAQ